MDSERYGDVAAELDQAVVDEGLAILAANRDRPYYDAAADADAAAQYYSAVDATATGQELIACSANAGDKYAYAYSALCPGPHGVPVGGPASRPSAPVDLLRQIL